MPDFVNLHVHSEYSLLDGLSTPEEIAQITRDNGQVACAITDHGVMGGHYRFYKACQDNDVKAIFGIEGYFVENLNTDTADKKAERFHIILLAKNDVGLSNLYTLSGKAWTDGFYHKPRIDFGMLESHSEGIIATSGCMGGIIAKALADGNESEAHRLASLFISIFKDDFYIEIQPWNPPSLNAALLSLADSMGIKPIVTSDCHFPRKEDQEIEEVLLCSGQHGSWPESVKTYAKEHAAEAKDEQDLIKKMDILYPERRLSFADLPLYIMDGTEVKDMLIDVDIYRDDVLSNTVEIAEKCNAKLQLGVPHLPSYSENTRSKKDSNTILRERCDVRMAEMDLLNDETYVKRLEDELEVIIGKSFSDYFLILDDVVTWADENGIARGPARGSAAGSLVSYLLQITSIDPLKHDLLFFRFMSPERNDFPDIDLDFEDKRRDEVKEYMQRRWGIDHVAGITTYSFFKPKSSVKKIASLFAAPYNDSNTATSQFEDFYEYDTNPALARWRSEWPDIGRVAKKIEGRIQSSGAHPAGIIVTDQPVSSIVPIETRKMTDGKRIAVTSFDKNEVEDFGLVKMDFLGVKIVTVIKETIQAIKDRHGVDVSEVSRDIYNPDPRVYEQISAGNTTGCFQIDAPAYKALCVDMGIESFNDLAVSNALVRPGSFQTQGKNYLARRAGKGYRTIHPILHEILQSTYGTFIFEEQVMQTAVYLAGFSWADADRLRKIISKKKDAAEFDQYKDRFIDGCCKHITANQAERIWGYIEKASTYMFNKSHAVAYSSLSYQTMWLKVNYPVEFYWASLSNENEREKVTTLIFEAKREGIDILPPDVGKSLGSFSLEGNGIRFGLTNISGVGDAASNKIINRRPYASHDDFINKAALNVNIVDALDKLNAYESLGHDSGYEREKYYASLLDYPILLEQSGIIDGIITSCTDAGVMRNDRDKFFIIRGIVKNTKRTDRYFRVEIEDATGTISCFASKGANISKRDFIVALVGDQTLHHYADYGEVLGGEGGEFGEFLRIISNEEEVWNPYDFLYMHDVEMQPTGFDEDKCLMYLVNTVEFTTKAGAQMASLYFWSPVGGFGKMVCFPQNYKTKARELSRIFEWKVVRARMDENGSFILDKIIGADDYIEMMSIERPILVS